MITDPRSSLTENYGNEIESMGVQFSGRGAPDKTNKSGSFAVALDSWKISALVPQEHLIRMCSDERDNEYILVCFFRYIRALLTSLCKALR